MTHRGMPPANRRGVAVQRPSRRAAVALACRRLLLVPLLWWAIGATGVTASPATAGAVAQKTIDVAGVPDAVADDSRTGRVFVATVDPVTQFGGAVVTLDAGSGKVLATVPLLVPDPHGKAARGRLAPVAPAGPGCVAVDDRNGRVFVLSAGHPGPMDKNATNPPIDMFMLDGTSGRLLATTSLVVL